MLTGLVGKVVEGQYKRAGRPSTTAALEVSAHVLLEDIRGQKVPYVFGTRLDGTSKGNVVLMRAGCFRESTLKVAEAVAFKPIDLAGWMVTPPSNGAAFAFVEKVAEADAPWADELGAKPLADFVVKAPAPEVAAPAA